MAKHKRKHSASSSAQKKRESARAGAALSPNARKRILAAVPKKEGGEGEELKPDELASRQTCVSLRVPAPGSRCTSRRRCFARFSPP